MNIKILVSLFVALLLGVGTVGAVVLAQQTDESGSALQEVQNTEQESIQEEVQIVEQDVIEEPVQEVVQSVDQEPIQREEQNLATFHNRRDAYTLKHPKDWSVYEVPSMSYIRVENFDSTKLRSKEDFQQYFKIEVVVLPNPNNLPLKEWVEMQNTTSYPFPEVISQEIREVGGQPALYQIEQFGSFVHPVVFIQKGEQIYILNISSNDERYTSTVDDFIRNFAFTL